MYSCLYDHEGVSVIVGPRGALKGDRDVRLFDVRGLPLFAPAKGRRVEVCGVVGARLYRQVGVPVPGEKFEDLARGNAATRKEWQGRIREDTQGKG